MLTTKPLSIAHHGWYIEIVPQEDNFCFQCYPSQRLDFCNDASVYISSEAALVAALRFVDREVAVLALIEQAAEWFDTGKISETEYWSLTDFD